MRTPPLRLPRRASRHGLLALVALVLTAAAAEGVPADATPVRVLEIGPRMVPCDDVVPRRCFEARAAGEAEWRPFEGELEGYDHRDGYAAVVLARQEAPGDDAARSRYVLMRTLAELPLGGARWELERYGPVSAQEDPLEYTEVAFAVTSGGTHVEGTGGCNAFAGPIAIVDDEVRIGPLVTERRTCDDDVMRQEAMVLDALRGATRITFYGDAVAFAGDDLRVRFGARLAPARLTWTEGPDDPEVARFNVFVDMAAADGASWTRDPIRVALALIDSRGAPRVDVTRRDDRAEAPTSTLVRVDEDGFLDDSVRGVRSEIVLAPRDHGGWHVLAITVVTRCWRGDRLAVAPGETCP